MLEKNNTKENSFKNNTVENTVRNSLANGNNFFISKGNHKNFFKNIHTVRTSTDFIDDI